MSLFGRELSSMVRYHWGAYGGNGEILGDIHENKKEVEKWIKKRVKKINELKLDSPPSGLTGIDHKKLVEEYISQWEARPIWLVEGEDYLPFGLRNRVTHGINDGTHGSGASNDVPTIAS